jgi:hypothetical protein
MAFHLPLVAVAGLVSGVTKGLIAVSEGDSASKAFEKGLTTGVQVSAAVATLGLISPHAGIDFKDNGQIALDPKGSCDAARNA